MRKHWKMALTGKMRRTTKYKGIMNIYKENYGQLFNYVRNEILDYWWAKCS